MFGDGDARHAGGGRLEFAADLRRGVRLEVEGFEVRRAAVLVNEDAGLGGAESIRPSSGRRGRGRARSQSDHASPVKPRPPTRRASRRVRPSRRRTLRPGMESKGDSSRGRRGEGETGGVGRVEYRPAAG